MNAALIYACASKLSIQAYKYPANYNFYQLCKLPSSLCAIVTYVYMYMCIRITWVHLHVCMYGYVLRLLHTAIAM